jgi:hypothetical protein
VAFRLGSKAAASRGEVSGVLTWVASGRCAGVVTVRGAMTRREAALVGDAERHGGEELE